jgi:large subunit ribosomal protein L3
MAHLKGHKRGSVAFRPRKRADSLVQTISTWPNQAAPGPLGFAAFKAGMTSVSLIDDSNSPSKGLEISTAATVLEVPPMTVYGVRAYVRTYMGKRSVGDILTNDEKILKTLGIVTKPNHTAQVEKHVDTLSDATLLVFANPSRTSSDWKKAMRMELAVGGKTGKEKYEFCKTWVGKELKFSDVFKEGEYVDVIGVTKGKGWQGAVKRFGVALQRRKATGKRRHVGTLGPWHPAKVMYTVPMAGQMGFHRRTEYNKRILKSGSNPADVIPRGGFLHYGLVHGDYVVLQGSVSGPAKRIVRLRKGVRAPAVMKKPEVKHISLTSKQGAS